MLLVHGVVDVVNHLVQYLLVLGVALEHGVQEVGVGEEQEHRVKSLHRLLLEVVLHQLAQVGVRLLQR